jgi:hypothetical protein
MKNLIIIVICIFGSFVAKSQWSINEVNDQKFSEQDKLKNHPLSSTVNSTAHAIWGVGVQIGSAEFGSFYGGDPSLLLQSLTYARDLAIESNCIPAAEIEQLRLAMANTHNSKTMHKRIMEYRMRLAEHVNKYCNCENFTSPESVNIPSPGGGNMPSPQIAINPSPSVVQGPAKGKVYFFKGGEYTRFDIAADKADPGYPKTISSETWNGLWTRDIDAAVNFGNGKIYFFKGGEYIRFDIAADKADPGFPKTISSETWNGLWSRDIDAAVNFGDGKIYFFKGSEYIRFDIAADKADPGYPKTISSETWNGLWSSGIDAAVNFGNGKIYFFKGSEYIRFDIATDKADPGYPQPISNFKMTWVKGIQAATAIY